VTSPEPGFTDNRQFWMWISKTPGGQVLDGAECSKFMARARGGMYWTQNSKWISGDRICYLGPSETLLYLNFTACMSDGFACIGPIASHYSFNVRRSYKIYWLLSSITGSFPVIQNGGWCQWALYVPILHHQRRWA